MGRFTRTCKKRIFPKLPDPKPRQNFETTAPYTEFESVHQDLEDLSQFIERCRNKSEHSSDVGIVTGAQSKETEIHYDDKRSQEKEGSSSRISSKRKGMISTNNFLSTIHRKITKPLARKMDRATNMQRSEGKNRQQRSYEITGTNSEETEVVISELKDKGDEDEDDEDDEDDDDDDAVRIIEIGEKLYVEKGGILQEFEEMDRLMGGNLALTPDENAISETYHSSAFERCGRRIEDHAKQLAQIRTNFEEVTKRIGTIHRMMELERTKGEMKQPG
jgi:hypothetical protein